MSAHPIMKQIRKPVRVPYQTCEEVSQAETASSAATDLFLKLPIYSFVVVGTNLLLEEREKDSNYDASLCRLTKDDEEHRNSENVDHLDVALLG